MASATSKKEPDLGTEHAGKRHGEDSGLQCVVVTPERTLLDRPVDFVALPLYDGELGVLPGRSPLIGRLGYGPLRVRSASSQEVYYVDGGFVQIRDNVVTVLTNRAIPADQINVEKVGDELKQARSRIATTDIDQDEKERAVARARAQLRIAERP